MRKIWTLILFTLHLALKIKHLNLNFIQLNILFKGTNQKLIGNMIYIWPELRYQLRMTLEINKKFSLAYSRRIYIYIYIYIGNLTLNIYYSRESLIVFLSYTDSIMSSGCINTMTASTANHLWSLDDVLGQGATASVYKARNKVLYHYYSFPIFITQTGHRQVILC